MTIDIISIRDCIQSSKEHPNEFVFVLGSLSDQKEPLFIII